MGRERGVGWQLAEAETVRVWGVDVVMSGIWKRRRREVIGRCRYNLAKTNGEILQNLPRLGVHVRC